MAFDDAIEKEIKEKGLTAPRVEKTHIDKLAGQFKYVYHNFEGTTTTVCAVFLDEFMLAIEYSACVSKENFDIEVGRKIARERAHNKALNHLWTLEGYHLHLKQKELV